MISRDEERPPARAAPMCADVIEQMLNYRLGAAVTIALLVACHARSSPAPKPQGAMIAPFVAESPHRGDAPPRNECWMAARFEGEAILRDGELTLAIPRAWVAVTRDNDKQWDELRLVVEVSAHPFSDLRWPALGKSLPVILQPTVDSAGPQLTTWQSDSTLRLFVPWKPTIGPRWLVLGLNYHTLSHSGVHASCGGRAGTDTLRFHAP